MVDNKVTLEKMREILGVERESTGKKVGEIKLNEDGNYEVLEGSLKAFSKDVKDYAVKELQPAISEAIAKTTAKDVDALAKKLQADLDKTETELMKLAESTRVIEIQTPKKVKKMTGVQHNQFVNLLRTVNAGQPVLLVGPAGTGKSYAAETIAEALSLSFHAISVGSQTSKSDLQGYKDGNGNYHRTQFREAYENGGIFLLDEADAGNSNVLILLNAALSNGYMAFPDGMIKAHDDFRIIATANTYGYGASRQYVGRNQLDAATLDRFAVINWDIDDRVEANLAGNTEDGKKWLRVVRAVRKKAVEELELRVVVSPRATQRGALLLGAGLTFEDVLQIALIGNMPATERKELENLAKATWSKVGA